MSGIVELVKEGVGIKRAMVRRFFERGVRLINQEANMQEFKDLYFPKEDRTLCLNIKGLEDLETGFTFEGGRVRVIRRLGDEPTVTIGLDEDTFLRICVGEMPLSVAFFYGFLEVSGKNYLRDMRIFQKMFDKHGATVSGKLRSSA